MSIMKHYRTNDKYKDAIVNVVKKEIQKEINVLTVEIEMSSKIKV